LFHAGAVLVGDEVRARVGLNSPIYFNLREPLYENPALLWNVGREFALKVSELAASSSSLQCVVGVPDTATPLAVATALYASEARLSFKMSVGLLRKGERDYRVLRLRDQMKWVGPKSADCEYNLIDDVVASGITKRAAACAMKRESVQPRRIIVLFDRQQGDGLREEGFDLHGVFTASDAVEFYRQQGFIRPSDFSQIKEFLAVRRFDSAASSR
jgi:orotate phosphoribosyltransferase